MKTKTNALAYRYLLCIATYSVLADLIQAASNLFPKGAISSDTLLVMTMTIPAYILMLLCGLMMGLLVKRKTILHASLAIMAGVSIQIQLFTGLAVGDYTRVCLMLVSGAVLGGFGGLVSAIILHTKGRRAEADCPI